MRKRIYRSGVPGLLKRLAHSRAGTVTVEFVVWLPVFVFLLALTADACKLYLTQADMWSVARDTARRMSTGELATPEAAETYASGQLLYPLDYTYTITQDTDDTVQISVPISDACVFGVLPVVGNFGGSQMVARVVMRVESEGSS
jgi:Flp pilus assembly protein TadG